MTISNGDDRVIEGRVYVGNPFRDVLLDLRFCALLFWTLAMRSVPVLIYEWVASDPFGFVH